MKMEQRKTINIKQSRFAMNSETDTNSKECMQLIPVQLSRRCIHGAAQSPEKLRQHRTK